MDHQLPDLEPEISFKTSRSGGKGGQNVNKVSTKVELNFDIAASLLLSEDEKAILMSKLNEKLTKEGMLQVISQSERTQLGNKRIALEKFYAILNACFVIRKKRKATKVSKAVKERRLLAKKRNAEVKKSRKNYDL